MTPAADDVACAIVAAIKALGDDPKAAADSVARGLAGPERVYSFEVLRRFFPDASKGMLARCLGLRRQTASVWASSDSRPHYFKVSVAEAAAKEYERLIRLFGREPLVEPPEPPKAPPPPARRGRPPKAKPPPAVPVEGRTLSEKVKPVLTTRQEKIRHFGRTVILSGKSRSAYEMLREAVAGTGGSKVEEE